MVQTRPPIVVILGHVDHGKTTLLDYLHNTHIASKEAGGITQSTRSFSLDTKDYGRITFIDTPGHEAFSQMRKRGSAFADIAILVVAADDGIKPQTKESISFIRESNIPMIVAINKIDLATADPDRIKTQLTECGVVVEEFGGNVPTVKISGKTGSGIPDLLELINLVASLSPPQADPEAHLEMVVLESRMDSKKGPLSTVLVKGGSLRAGAELFQNASIGKVRAILDSEGQSVKMALPSSPVEVMGLSLVPQVGSSISDVPISASSPVLSHPKVANTANHNFIIKADVAGSLEAILSNIGQQANVVSSGTGDINENDILFARTSGASVLGFNVKLSSSVQKLAETEKVSVNTFRIIYELFQFVEELLHPKVTEQVVGKASVLADFKIESERIAGCRCTEGYIDRSCTIKLIRQGILVNTTNVKSLQQGKRSVEKIKSGTEFGVVFSPSIDFRVGDDIIATIG